MLLDSLEIPFSNSTLKTGGNLFSGFVRVSPSDSLTCPLSINVWTWHNGKELHFYFSGEIDHDFERGIFSSYDKKTSADYFRVQIITDVNSYFSYVFYCYPLGNKYDAIRKPSLSFDKNWNSSYNYNSDISDKLWNVDLIIPFKDLRFSGNPPYNWKIILTRYFDKNDESYSVPFVNTNMGKDYFRRAENIRINEKIDKNKNFYIRPYSILTYDLIDKNTSLGLENIGTDFSFKPDFSTNLKVSLNPDFSDIPLDDETDIYNSKYDPDFSENRYFFTEDFNAFGIDDEQFYSRHIIQPNYAIKLTGNSDDYSYGFLSTMDREEHIDGIDVDDDMFNIIAFNPKKENYNFQFTVLNRMNKNYHNEVFHLNPVWEFSENNILNLDLNYSYKDKDDIKSTGFFHKIGYDIYADDFNLNLEFEKMNDDYAVDMGKLYEKNYYQYRIYSYKEVDLYKTFLKELGTSINLREQLTNGTNELIEKVSRIDFWINSHYKIDLWYYYVFGKENYCDKIHSLNNNTLGLSWKISSFLKLQYSYSSGKILIYEFNGAYRNIYHQFYLSGDIDKFVSYKFTADNIQYKNIPHSDTTDNNFWYGNADLTISLSNNISITNGLRFNNYEENEFSDHFGFFSNFSWEFRPESNIFIGFKSTVDEIEKVYTKAYEQLFMKISYRF